MPLANIQAAKKTWTHISLMYVYTYEYVYLYVYATEAFMCIQNGSAWNCWIAAAKKKKEISQNFEATQKKNKKKYINKTSYLIE